MNSSKAEQEVVNRLGKKMLEILEKYAKSNGYRGPGCIQPADARMWASQSTISPRNWWMLTMLRSRRRNSAETRRQRRRCAAAGYPDT